MTQEKGIIIRLTKWLTFVPAFLSWSFAAMARMFAITMTEAPTLRSIKPNTGLANHRQLRAPSLLGRYAPISGRGADGPHPP